MTSVGHAMDAHDNTNPDLADILGRTDFDFENFYFLDFLGSQIAGLGPAWAQLGPSLGPAWII